MSNFEWHWTAFSFSIVLKKNLWSRIIIFLSKLFKYNIQSGVNVQHSVNNLVFFNKHSIKAVLLTIFNTISITL